MGYISTVEAAEKWNISRRSVRQYIENDRIPGVIKSCGRILIPEDAEKPHDRRKKSTDCHEVVIAPNPFVLTTAVYTPGCAEGYLSGVEDEEKRILGNTELAFFRGDVRLAEKLASELESSESSLLRCGSFLAHSMCSMYTGNLSGIMTAYTLVKNVSVNPQTTVTVKKLALFFNLYFNIMVHNTKQLELPGVAIDAFAVEKELRPMAVYAYAHYLHLTGDTDRAIGLCEGVIAMMRRTCPVSEIFLCLLLAAGYVSKSVWDKAEYYFRYAWSIASPDRLFLPFAEYRGVLFGLLEKCLRYDYPEEYKYITELALAYHGNWISVHNALTGDTVSDKLTGIEFNIAMLASRGVSNSEIAEYLGISVNSVRAHLRNIFNKLCIGSRKELLKYVIK